MFAATYKAIHIHDTYFYLIFLFLWLGPFKKFPVLKCFICYHFLLVCKAELDLVFVVQASRSIGPKNFRRLKQFLQQLVSAFSITPRSAKVGIVLYSSRRVISVPLGRFPTLSRLRSVISRLPLINGKIYTGHALQYAKNRLFARSSRKKTLVVLTATKSKDGLSRVLKATQGNILYEK